jgi:amino acid transporter
MGISVCIGAGIFVISTNLHSELKPYGIGNMVVLAYIIGAIPALASAYICGVCSSLWPSCGGDYTYYKRSINNKAGYIVTWCSFITSPFQIQASAIASVSFFSLGLEVMGYRQTSMQIQKYLILISALFLFLGFIINFLRIEGFVAPITFCSTILFVLILIGYSISHNHTDFSNITGISLGNYNYLEKPSSMGLIMGTAIIMFSYGGITLGQNAGEECTGKFSKTYMKSVLLGLIISAFIYILISFLVYKAVPWQYIAETSSKDQNFSIIKALASYIPKNLIGLCYLLLGISILDNMYIIAFKAARQGYAMSRDNIFPKVFQKVYNGGPGFMVIIIYIISLILLLLFHFENLALTANYSYCLGFVFTGIVGLSLTESEIAKLGRNTRVIKLVIRIASVSSIILYSLLFIALSVSMIKMTLIWILLVVIGFSYYLIRTKFLKSNIKGTNNFRIAGEAQDLQN